MAHEQIQELLADARDAYGVFDKAQRALDIVDRALALEPRHVEALNLDRDDAAETCHQQALAIEPCSVEALHGLAALANDRQDYALALQWAERGIACIPDDPYPEFIENEDYRQRLIAELLNEQAFALWYTDRRGEAEALLTVTGPNLCPLEVETLEDQLEWLEHHPDSPEE